MVQPLFTDSEWNFDVLENVYNACETVAFNELNLENVFKLSLLVEFLSFTIRVEELSFALLELKAT